MIESQVTYWLLIWIFAPTLICKWLKIAIQIRRSDVQQVPVHISRATYSIIFKDISSS